MHSLEFGGFHEAIKQVIPQAQCLGFSEIDKYAIQIYKKNFEGCENYGDIRKMDRLPEGTELLVGGFPCQAFSIAGKRAGFEDARGTLFFELARLLRQSKPKYFIFENVKGLLSHDKGRTFGVILYTLGQLGYDVQWQVMDSQDWGLAQHRERVFIVGNLRTESRPKVFPLRNNDKISVKGLQEPKNNTFSSLTATDYKGVSKQRSNCILEQIGTIGKDSEATRVYSTDGIATSLASQSGGQGGKTELYQIMSHYGHLNKEPTISDLAPTLKAQSHGHEPMVVAVLTPDRSEKRQNGRRFKEAGEPSFTLTAQDKHGLLQDSRIRRLTPTECERLQGFPDGHTEGISDSQRYKCLGNAVSVNVVREIVKKVCGE